MDLTQALAPKSDQLDFADLEGSAPQVFTITEVSENGTELAEQQPVNIRLAEFPRWWRPSKGMLRVMADNWGKDVKVWVGRQVELYGDPNVYFGKEKRGGTRISRLSHITASKTTLVNPRGGRGAYWKVDPLPAVSTPAAVDLTGLTDAFNAAGITERDDRLAKVRAVLGREVKSPADLSEAEVQQVVDALTADLEQPFPPDAHPADDIAAQPEVATP